MWRVMVGTTTLINQRLVIQWHCEAECETQKAAEEIAKDKRLVYGRVEVVFKAHRADIDG